MEVKDGQIEVRWQSKEVKYTAIALQMVINNGML